MATWTLAWICCPHRPWRKGTSQLRGKAEVAPERALFAWPFMTPCFAIPSGSYRAKKKTLRGRKYEKKIRKKYDKIPHPGLGPENTKEKKNSPKKYTKMTPKWSLLYFFGNFFVFSGPFCIFSVIFSYFRGPTQGGGFRNVFVFFFVFPASEGFCALYEPDGIASLVSISPIWVPSRRLFLGPLLRTLFSEPFLLSKTPSARHFLSQRTLLADSTQHSREPSDSVLSAKVKRGREKGDGKNSVINCRKTVVNCRDAFMTLLCHMNKASEMS